MHSKFVEAFVEFSAVVVKVTLCLFSLFTVQTEVVGFLFTSSNLHKLCIPDLQYARSWHYTNFARKAFKSTQDKYYLALWSKLKC